MTGYQLDVKNEVKIKSNRQEISTDDHNQVERAIAKQYRRVYYLISHHLEEQGCAEVS